MSALVSSWWNNVESLPENYVLPPEKRPGELAVPMCKDIPVIDLGQADDQAGLLKQIIKASEEFGLFQVINHGVSEILMGKATSLLMELFNMPAEEKAIFYSEDKRKRSRLYTSGRNFVHEEVHFWKDTLQHPCYPLKDHIQSWPNKPAKYQEVVGRYSEEVRKLSLRLLDLICKGLGLEERYFGDKMSKNQTLVVNFYPPCPDPSLALGSDGHRDPNLITLLQQGVSGLQVMKDGQWVGVDPFPNAFVVSISYQLEVISNGKLRSPFHRAVTNSTIARISIVTLIGPSPECFVQPANELVSASNPPLYKAFQFKELIENYMVNLPKIGDLEAALDSYKLQ